VDGCWFHWDQGIEQVRVYLIFASITRRTLYGPYREGHMSCSESFGSFDYGFIDLSLNITNTTIIHTMALFRWS
jgi:hypothetical protein